ncbi:hypothetical protein ABW21_db0203347 [Orbilia brochopaga]|nr:hypothetical protein ABW21_db0203347 [Drechslerella brochopaga]
MSLRGGPWHPTAIDDGTSQSMEICIGDSFELATQSASCSGSQDRLKKPTASMMSTPRKAPKPIPASDQAELDSVQDFLKDLLAERPVSSERCPHFPMVMSSIFALIAADDRKTSARYIYGNKICVGKCPECKGGICLGCGRKIIVGVRRATSLDHLARSNHQCMNSHLMSIILILAKLDARWKLMENSLEEFIKAKKEQDDAKKKQQKAKENCLQDYKVGLPRNAGVGYSTGWDYPKLTLKALAQPKHEIDDQEHLATLLVALTECLQDDEYQFTVPRLISEKGSTLASFMKISYLPEFIRQLVQNDSLLDIEEKGSDNDYGSCLMLFSIFADHEPLLDILTSALRGKKSSPGIAGLAGPIEDFPNSLKKYITAKELTSVKASMRTENLNLDFAFVDGPDGTRQPIIQAFEKLVKQCEVCVMNASHFSDESDAEVKQFLEFCGNMKTTSLKMQRAAKAYAEKKESSRVLSSASKNSHLADLDLSPDILAHPLLSSGANPSDILSATPSDPLDIPKDIQQECQKSLSAHLQFEFSMDVVNTHFNAPASMVTLRWIKGNANATNPDRMKRLMKDLSVLSTALPLNVFVRVQEDRPDLFKVLIVGPDSTPYHLGLYEFDFSIPCDYPSSPPIVVFKTTGGGKVNFNPNLYSDGKVCLSILGTWAGAASENWQPGKSTLLQVVVSLQALVLCNDPFYNEPDSEMYAQPTECRLYNEQVQLNNIRIAMNDWLTYDGIWNKVVQTHFLANAAAILAKTLEFVTGTPAKDVFNLSDDDINDDDDDADQNFGVVDHFLHHDDHPKTGTILEAMTEARSKLEENMKEKLPEFLKACPWKGSGSP